MTPIGLRALMRALAQRLRPVNALTQERNDLLRTLSRAADAGHDGSAAAIDPEVQRIKDWMSGQSPDARRTVEFETQAGQPYQVRIEPGRDGFAQVDFGAGMNWDEAARDAQFPDRSGRSPDAMEVFNNVERIIREDAAVNARAGYRVSGSYGRLKDIYERMAQRRPPPPGYVLDASDSNTLVWRRTGDAGP